MGDNSEIEWTDATWNPVTGCSKVSPGCAHCYAETISLRFGRSVGPWTPANAAENVVLHPNRLEQPLRWRRPRMIFVNSMSDLFHEQVPNEYIAQVFDVMAQAPQHVFQVLTKRPERMRDLLVDWQRHEDAWAELLPLPNVWLGTSIENRRFVGRAVALRQTPAAVRFISAEPLLGPLVARFVPEGELGEWVWPDGKLDMDAGAGLDLVEIDWLIVGGESGARHRPIREEWVRDLRNAAVDYGTAFFFKQWGGRTPKAGGRELDGRTWDQMPRQLEATVA